MSSADQLPEESNKITTNSNSLTTLTTLSTDNIVDNNIDIFVGYTKDSPLSVDTQEDLEKIRKMI